MIAMEELIRANLDLLYPSSVVEQAYAFREVAPGTYEKSAPALVMVGHWALTFEITPPGRAPLEVLLVDRASG